jgi:hypothetical protein
MAIPAFSARASAAGAPTIARRFFPTDFAPLERARCFGAE